MKQERKHCRTKRLTREQKISISKCNKLLKVANWFLLEETEGAYILKHKKSGKIRVVLKV